MVKRILILVVISTLLMGTVVLADNESFSIYVSNNGGSNTNNDLNYKTDTYSAVVNPYTGPNAYIRFRVRDAARNYATGCYGTYMGTSGYPGKLYLSYLSGKNIPYANYYLYASINDYMEGVAGYVTGIWAP